MRLIKRIHSEVKPFTKHRLHISGARAKVLMCLILRYTGIGLLVLSLPLASPIAQAQDKPAINSAASSKPALKPQRGVLEAPINRCR